MEMERKSPSFFAYEEILENEIERLQHAARAETVHYRDLELSSAFQPIFSIAHRKAIGFEALLRAKDASGNPVSPMAVFALPKNDVELVFLDRLVRILHLHNFRILCQGDFWSFLNLNIAAATPQFRDPDFFPRVFDAFGINPALVVAEILEHQIKDETMLDAYVKHLRQLGCLCAIDDFGAGHSNLHRIFRLAPEIVKIDRSLFVNDIPMKRLQTIMPGLVEMIHDMGAICLFEGVEEKEQAILAISSNADLLQGYYFGRPLPEPVLTPQNTISFETLAQASFDASTAVSKSRHTHFHPYIKAFQKALNALKIQENFSAANLKELLSLPDSIRCFVLDHKGDQIGENILAPHVAQTIDSRFLPFEKSDGANWRHRPYFIEAVTDIDSTHVSRPYFSITGAQRCITISGASMTPHGLRVLCCDLKFDGRF